MRGAPTPGPWDPGLQPERTLLAWRRTTLALAVIGATVIRFTAPVLGPAVVPVGLVGLLLCGAAYLGAAQQYRSTSDHLMSTGRPGLGRWGSPGTACAALTVALLLIAAAALAFVLARAERRA